MTESEKQKVNREGTCIQNDLHNEAKKRTDSGDHYAAALMESAAQYLEIAYWEEIPKLHRQINSDREKIREALALLENEFDHGGECDHCNEPMTKHRDTCPIGNTIGILKQLTL